MFDEKIIDMKTLINALEANWQGYEDLRAMIIKKGDFFGNDTEEETHKIKDFLAPYKPLKVEILPYHRMGEHKYAALGMDLISFDVPDKAKAESFNKLLAK